MRGLRPRSGSAVDSLLLASVKLVTLGSTMANTMILSHSLSLEAYGTYAQGVLLVTLCADATILGLADAVNFFFNRDSRESAGREDPPGAEGSGHAAPVRPPRSAMWEATAAGALPSAALSATPSSGLSSAPSARAGPTDLVSVSSPSISVAPSISPAWRSRAR